MDEIEANIILLKGTRNSSKCIIKRRILELLAEKINSIETLKSDLKMGDFLNICGVDKKFYQHIMTLSHMAKHLKTNSESAHIDSRTQLISRILSYYSCSKRKNKKILFKIIENSTDSLLFKANEIKSSRFESELNQILKLENYCVLNGKIKKVESEKRKPKIKVFESKNIGYLAIDKKIIKIGLEESGKYQLLKQLVTYFGKARTIEYLFEKIEKYTKNKMTDPSDKYLSKTYKKTKLENLIKELQSLIST